MHGSRPLLQDYFAFVRGAKYRVLIIYMFVCLSAGISNKWSKKFDIRPHRCRFIRPTRTWTDQSYSPGGDNVHPCTNIGAHCRHQANTIVTHASPSR